MHHGVLCAHSLWNISADDGAFSVAKDFAETVATTTWSNLHNFARFVNDSEQLRDVDMRQLAFMVREKKISFLTLAFPFNSMKHEQKKNSNSLLICNRCVVN